MHVHDDKPEKGIRRRARQSRAEQPAAHGAEEVLRLQRSVGNAATSRMITSGREEQEAAQPVQRSSVHEVLNKPGSRLPADVQTEAKARTGVDLSNVKVHTDAAAARSAKEMGASAYTSGENMVFTPGSFNWKTLLHEAKHVEQQRNGPVEGTDQGDGTRMSDPSDRHEQQAEKSSAEALQDDPARAHEDVLDNH